MVTKSQKSQIERGLCRRCKHYYITWESEYPHGCRGFNMKSKQYPAMVVQKNSGTSCLLFEKKRANKSKYLQNK